MSISHKIQIDSIMSKLLVASSVVGYVAEKEMESDDVLIGNTLKVAEEMTMDARDEFQKLMQELGHD